MLLHLWLPLIYGSEESSVEAGGKQSFHAGFLLGLFFEPEDEADTFLRNVHDSQLTTRHYIPEERALQALTYFSSLGSQVKRKI
jgi:hypothetical protein